MTASVRSYATLEAALEAGECGRDGRSTTAPSDAIPDMEVPDLATLADRVEAAFTA